MNATRTGLRARAGWWMRCLADRIDPDNAPRLLSSISFTIEHKKGIVVRQDGRGCPLWRMGHADYQRAHSEADTEHAIVDWVNGTARFGR